MPRTGRKRRGPSPDQERGVTPRSTRITGTPRTTSRGHAASAAATCACETFHLQDHTGKLRLWPSLLAGSAQQRLFEELTLNPDLLPLDPTTSSGGGTSSGGNSGLSRREDGNAARGRWMQRPIKLFGREILQPRLTCFYGLKGVTYRYSGKTLEAMPWEGVPAIQEILAAAEAATGVQPGYFNCVLLNWYRDGTDYMGWHSDDEKELEKGAAIASVSLGAGRRFQLRRKTDKTQQVELLLGGGSLLLMEGTTQENWQHCVPKRTAKEERDLQKRADREREGVESLSLRPSSLQAGRIASRASPSADESGRGGGLTLLTVGGPARAPGGAGGDIGGRINLTFRRVKVS